MHKENIKAEIRKAFDTLGRFEVAYGLPSGAVKDLLRGRVSANTERAISRALKLPLHKVFPQRYDAPKGRGQSTKVDDTTIQGEFHRLSGEAR